MSRILAIGDIMGKAGRRCLDQMLGKAREKFQPDIVLCNGENAAGGFGLTEKVYNRFVSWDIDAVTMGNHWHDKREIHDFLPRAERIILPANMNNVERDDMGLKILTSTNGVRFAVINLIGRAFMKGENRCPFTTVDKLLASVPESVRIRVLDIHAEATSEKQGLGRYVAGRVSLVYGTHSHVPTADERVFTEGTGYTTDLGMTGAYDSVIGIRKEAAIQRLLTGEKKKFEPATGDPWMCFVVAEVDDNSGHCTGLTRHRWELSQMS